MAELFFQELDPVFISRPTTDVGYDLLVGFLNEKGGVNSFAVDVKGTERPPGKRFQLSRRTFDRIANSNIPGLLLVVDVKHNGMYYAWITPKNLNGSGSNVMVPLIEINDATSKELKRELKSFEGGIAVAG
jgi:hypothetical protein